MAGGWDDAQALPDRVRPSIVQVGGEVLVAPGYVEAYDERGVGEEVEVPDVVRVAVRAHYVRDVAGRNAPCREGCNRGTVKLLLKFGILICMV
jgi:hypothetical protein